MTRLRKQELKMRPDHTWRAKAGYKIFVADRGAARFDIPQDWVIMPKPDGGAIVMHDREPPDDDCRLSFSLFRLPPGIDWTGLPLDRLLRDSIKDREGEAGKKEYLEVGEIVAEHRLGTEMVWIETRWLDEESGREACSRHLLARGAGVMPFVTLDFWPEDAKRLNPAWRELIRSLRLGQYVRDPTLGPPIEH